MFLFPDAGAMTESAANALLKTLEEPSGQVVFLLVAESEDDFPPTVASRCRTVHMGRIPQSELAEALVARGIGDDEARGVAVVSGGRPGLALSLMSQPEVARFRDMWLAIPGKVTPHPGDGQRLATMVLDELSPLVEESVQRDLPKDKAQRARRRAEMSLLVSGLEILASWYSDSASLQLGGPIRNGDLDLASLTDVSRVGRCQPPSRSSMRWSTSREPPSRLVLANLFWSWARRTECSGVQNYRSDRSRCPTNSRPVPFGSPPE